MNPETSWVSWDLIQVLPPGDWRIRPILPIADGPQIYTLEHQEPARLQWIEMYRADSYEACTAARETYREGETPESTEWMP